MASYDDLGAPRFCLSTSEYNEACHSNGNSYEIPLYIKERDEKIKRKETRRRKTKITT